MVEVSEPNTPSADEALVHVEYAPIAYSDLLLANGVYFLHPKPPSVIGGEGAGIVEACNIQTVPNQRSSRTVLRGDFEDERERTIALSHLGRPEHEIGLSSGLTPWVTSPTRI